MISTSTSQKGFVPAALLCYFLGSFGIHRFYIGKIGTGILMLVTLGAFGIWTMIDFIIIVCGSFNDSNGLPIRQPEHPVKSEKGFVPTVLLCYFLGSFGIHRFYAGKIGTGLLMLVTFGGFGIWTMIDLIILICGNFEDSQGLLIRQ